MKKLFIAVLTAGVCFGVTNVEAKGELRHMTCLQIQERADKNMAWYNFHRKPWERATNSEVAQNIKNRWIIKFRKPLIGPQFTQPFVSDRS